MPKKTNLKKYPAVKLLFEMKVPQSSIWNSYKRRHNIDDSIFKPKEYAISTDLTFTIGPDKATLLHVLYHLLKREGIVIKEVKWLPKSLKDWHEEFGYWSEYKHSCAVHQKCTNTVPDGMM